MFVRADQSEAEDRPPQKTLSDFQVLFRYPFRYGQDSMDVQLNKAGVFDLLRQWASHPNNK
jgi:hypothetical protein